MFALNFFPKWFEQVGTPNDHSASSFLTYTLCSEEMHPFFDKVKMDKPEYLVFEMVDGDERASRTEIENTV